MFNVQKSSGAKIYLEKTVGMYLGKWRNKNLRFKNIKWSTKPVKALGVFHGYAIEMIFKYLCQECNMYMVNHKLSIRK
jgi:hypothetical protein